MGRARHRGGGGGTHGWARHTIGIMQGVVPWGWHDKPGGSTAHHESSTWVHDSSTSCALRACAAHGCTTPVLAPMASVHCVPVQHHSMPEYIHVYMYNYVYMYPIYVHCVPVQHHSSLHTWACVLRLGPRCQSIYTYTCIPYMCIACLCAPSGPSITHACAPSTASPL